MHKIWKHALTLESYVEVNLPKGSKLLKVDAQFDQPCFWFLCDSEEEVWEIRRFLIVGTGHPIEFSLDDLTYIDTFQMSGGTYIWHIFEHTPHKH